jgi:hypothetical protein
MDIARVKTTTVRVDSGTRDVLKLEAAKRRITIQDLVANIVSVQLEKKDYTYIPDEAA